MCDTKLRASYFEKVHAAISDYKKMTTAEFQAVVDKCITT
jgi:hypothetical protein